MPERSTMNVSLTPEPVEFVGDRVRPGRHGSASKVVHAGLRLLQREEPATDRPVPGGARKNLPKARSDG